MEGSFWGKKKKIFWFIFRTRKEISQVSAGDGDSDGRYGHTAFVYNNVVYTIGGGNKQGGYVGDVLRYDLGKNLEND